MSDASRSTAPGTNVHAGGPPRYYRWLSHWRDLLAVTKVLRELIDARLPLAQGLLQLSADAPRRTLRYTFYWLHRELSGGLTLYQAMENQPGFFPPFYVKLIEAGENGGQLAEVLADLEDELQEQLSFRRRVATMNKYLGATLSIQLLFVTYLMAVLVPRLSVLSEHLGASPPAMLRWANAVHGTGITIVLLCASFCLPVLWVALEFSRLRGGSLSQAWSRVAPWLPLIGLAQRRGQLATTSAILGRLLRAGVPLSEAIRTTAHAALPAACQEPFRRVAMAVEGGDELRDALNREYAFFPADFRTLVALGESSGQLPEALHQISILYRTRSVHRHRMALEMGAPLLIMLNGLLVFIIYGAVFTAIMSYPSMIS